MAMVKAKIDNIQKMGGGAKNIGDLFINAGTRPYYLADVTHNEKTYQVKSMFYPSGEYVGFDPGSEPDKNGYYTEQEAAELMRLAQRNNCRICQAKVKAMAKAAGLTIFESES